MHRRRSEILIGGCMFAYGATAQLLDPIKNYCTRFEHQSAVKNDMLYIYMGSETFVDVQVKGGYVNGPITVGYNDYVVNVNLSTSWDWKTNISETYTKITANPTTGSTPPQVVRGALYQGTDNDDSVYLYGGTTSFQNTSFPGWQNPAPPTYSLWSFDTKSTQWSQFDISHDAPYRPSNGAAAEAVDQSLAFYFNGELDSGSSSQWGRISDNNVLLSGMIVINTTDRTARNLSTAQVDANLARARGRMQYLPGVGEKGALVLIGGSTFPTNQLDSTDIINLLPMTEIDVFDIASLYNTSTPNGVWYKQKAGDGNSSEIPSPRVDFCLIAASSQDSSSHNIYMYGGRDGANPPNYFDEIWVLSIPSFTWTKIYIGTSPRFAHTCHLVGNRTMLTVGGVEAASQMQGLYSSNIAQCDWERKGVGVYDISDSIWGSVFNPNTPAYEVPDAVVSTIGGNRTGGATVRKPAPNFSQSGLARIFGIELDDDANAAPVPDRKRTAIIAGTVCGVVVLAALLALAGYMAWRWRKKHAYLEDPIHEKGVEPDDHVDHPIFHEEAVERVEAQRNSTREYSRPDRPA